MMPDIEREARRRKVVPYIGWIMTVALVAQAVCMTFLSIDWQWVPIAVGTVAVTVIAGTIDPPGRDELGSRRRNRVRPGGGGVAVLGADDRQDSSWATAGQGRLMIGVSWLMPRAAGLRWLAEAGSLLAEIDPARRGQAIRSYLLSAPALAAAMWAREVRRARR